MSLKDLIFTLPMTGNGSKVYDIPAGYNYMTVFNTSDNTITGYHGSSADGQLIFQWNLFTGQTVPMKAGTEVYLAWTNGDSVQQPKPVQVVFSVGNLGVSTTFGNSSGNQMTLAVDSVGLARQAQLPAALSGTGNLKVEVENLPATQPVSGTVNNQQGTLSSLNITASSVVKAASGRAVRVNVIVAGTTSGTVNDCTTPAAAAAANEVFSIPNTVGSYLIDWPCAAGIVVVPGTGQTIALSYI